METDQQPVTRPGVRTAKTVSAPEPSTRPKTDLLFARGTGFGSQSVNEGQQQQILVGTRRDETGRVQTVPYTPGIII